MRRGLPVARATFERLVAQARARASGRGQRGLTLIELMVTITLIMLFVVVGAVSLGTIGVADTDTTANTLASAMRYTSTLAVHNNKTYRLVIDMSDGGQRWWVEFAGNDDPCARFVPDDADPPADAADIAELDDKPDDEDVEVPITASYQAVEEDLLTGKFEPETTVSAVLTTHHREPQEDGKVAIYFYPNGNAERAWIWVAQEHEEDGRRVIEPEVTLALESLGGVERFTRVLNANDFDKGISR